ncbi:hypothetical protein SDC9_133963 [bioreactor metagenome]|uniref:Uncharacterized protein n=1 Tax=bioreactor metagenome TaxID=1076179 RepID=A0A645DC23_9ZZZZ
MFADHPDGIFSGEKCQRTGRIKINISAVKIFFGQIPHSVSSKMCADHDTFRTFIKHLRQSDRRRCRFMLIAQMHQYRTTRTHHFKQFDGFLIVQIKILKIRMYFDTVQSMCQSPFKFGFHILHIRMQRHKCHEFFMFILLRR